VNKLDWSVREEHSAVDGKKQQEHEQALAVLQSDETQRMIADAITDTPSEEPCPETPTGKQVPNPTGNVWSHEAGCIPAVLNGERGVVITNPRRRKVAVVGFASSTRSLAPFDSSEHEVWALNQLYRHIPRADRWFDIHSNYDEHVVEGTDHVGWLEQCPIPVYMNEWRMRYPTSVRYPIEEVIEYFGKDYFTSTIAFMIALAIKEGFEEIELYGIDLVVGTEWEQQRQCAEYYIGWARGMGIKVTVAAGSALLTQRYRYGYQTGPDDLIHEEDFAIRTKRIQGNRDKVQIHLALIDGALQECEFHYNEILTPGNVNSKDIEEFANSILKERAFEIKKKRDEIQNQLILLDGALQEDEYWKQIYTLRSRGATVYSSE
jgi:hypothetical protein